VRRWVRKLVYIRNKLLQSLKVLHLFKNNIGQKRVLYPLTKEDHANLTDIFLPLKEQGILNNFELYKINKKGEDKEYTSDIEMSE